MSLHRLVIVAMLSSALAVASGCDGGDPEPADQPEPLAGKPTAVPRSAQLASLGRRLDSDYSVEAIRGAELPNRRRLLAPKPGTDTPTRVRAIDGLRVELGHGRSPGYVYRYSSERLATVGAESFLGANDPFDGISGCGRNVYYAHSHGKAADEWRREVASYLRRNAPGCRSHGFMVIE